MAALEGAPVDGDLSVSTAMHALIALGEDLRPGHADRHLGRRARQDVARDLRVAAGRPPTCTAAQRHPGALDVAADEAPVVLRARAPRCPAPSAAWAGTQGPRAPRPHRPPRHRAVLGERHRPARSILDRTWEAEARRPRWYPSQPTARRAADDGAAAAVGPAAASGRAARRDPGGRSARGTPLGNLGTGAIRPGIAGLSLGTSGALRLVVEAPCADPSGRVSSATPSPTTPGSSARRSATAAPWCGGRDRSSRPTAPTAVHDRRRSPCCASPMRSSRAATGSSCRRSSSPSAAPSGTPTYEAPSSASGQHHTRGHFVRAAVEGVAFQLATILDGLDRSSARQLDPRDRRRPPHRLWREVVLGVLGRPLVVTDGAEGSALGAAALGLYAIGAPDSLESAPSATLAPRPARRRRPRLTPRSPIRTTPRPTDMARVSAARRLRDLAAAADLLAGPDRTADGNAGQLTGNNRQLVAADELPVVH